MKKVLVKWKDIYTSDSWKNDKELKEWINAKEKEVCETLGFILIKNKNFIAVAGSYDGDESYGDVVIIPKTLIKEIKELHET